MALGKKCITQINKPANHLKNESTPEGQSSKKVTPPAESEKMVRRRVINAMKKLPRGVKNKLGLTNSPENIADRYIKERGTDNEFVRQMDAILVRHKLQSRSNQETPEERERRLEESAKIQNSENVSIEHIILKYFLYGGKVDAEAVKKEIIGIDNNGKLRSHNEWRKRFWFTKKPEFKERISIDQLREKLLQGTPFEQAGDEINGFRNEIIEVMFRYPTRNDMHERALELSVLDNKENSDDAARREYEEDFALWETQRLKDVAEAIDADLENLINSGILDDPIIPEIFIFTEEEFEAYKDEQDRLEKN